MWGDIGPMGRTFKHEPQAETSRSNARAIATFVAVAFSLLCVRSALLGPWLLLDADLGWHLGYGELIAANLELPRVDQWSWTRPGAPYQLTQWGGEALLGVANLLGGEAGLLLLNSVTVAASLAMMYSLATQLVTRMLGSMVVGLAGFMLLAGAVRPTMFSWLLAAALASLCVKAAGGKRAAAIAGTSALIVVWTNVHGSFALAVAVMSMFWLCMAARDLKSGNAAGAAVCLGAVALAWAATLINPYGWKVWQAVYAVANLETTQSRYFSDWKAPDVMSGLALPAWLAACAALVVVVRRKSAWLAVACVGVIGLSMSAQRNAGLAAVAANAVVCLALSGSWLDRRLAKEGGGTGPSGIGWHVGAAIACLGSATWLVTAVDTDRVAKAQASLYPTVCRQALATASPSERSAHHQLPQAKLLNEFEHGGWWQRQPVRVKISIDGRADLFGDEAYRDLETIKQAGNGWEEVLTRLQPDAICLSVKSAIFTTEAFKKGYELRSADTLWALWVRRKEAS